MAAVELLPPTRSHINDFLRGDQLSTKFHELFDSKEEAQKKKNEKKKTKKKPKPKAKDKKNKRDKSPEVSEAVLPIVELAGNPSSFNVYAHVRQTVLEQCMKDAVKVYQKGVSVQVSDTDTEEEVEDKGREPTIKIPKIVGIGLNGVFELIKETCHGFPELCVKALQALLDMLQGQQPESMKSEPADVIDSMYHLLIDIAKGQIPEASQSHQEKSLSSLACATLLSLVIARGDTGKLLTAIAAMLMSPAVLATQEMQVPIILTSLQRSIQAVLLGKTQLPDWLSCGVKEKALRDTFKLKDFEPVSSSCAIASDGNHLYIHNKLGLYKIGTGYGGTVKGHVYAMKQDFYNSAKSWLSFAAGKMYFKDLSSADGELKVICTETLEVFCTANVEGGVSCSNVLFSDGEHIGQVAAAKDDSFVVRTYSPDMNPMTVSGEVPLKLARKCLDTFGSSPIDDQVDIHAINTGYEEDIGSIGAGKEFALIKTVNGKVLYSGKSQSLGIKQGGPSQGKWAELSITKSPKISQIAVGHEGQHALLVADDGSVFFVGTPKRGEDGDSSVLKARRQPKPLKPKKMIKVETKFIVYASCNNGTSAVVSREGEVFMYGKDTAHCDHASGQVMDLKNIVISQVSLGKAHAAVLSSKGRVYTYGINNKGQCGRDYNPGASREAANTIVNMVDEEEDNETEDVLCAPGKHKWKTSQCMVCTVCGECTGYGNRCINSGSSERNPGMPCLCGAGDSGCSECGCCKTCAGDQVEERELIDQLNKSKDLNFLDLVLCKNSQTNTGRARLTGRPGAQQLDQLSKKLEQKKKTPRFKVFLNSIRPSKSNRVEVNEAEPEYSKLTSLAPAEVLVGNGDVQVTQIACGLHHTVLLLQNGSVYTFGSNQYGQLGLGDTLVRGMPTRVSLPSQAVQVAAGSNHTVILLANGQVLTCGNFQKGSLGRVGQEEAASNLGAREKKATWFTVPGVVPGIGAMFGRRATWIGASGDQTFLRVDESLINAHTLAKSNVFANQSCIGLIPTGEEGGYTIRCLVINKQDGSCKSFSGADQVDLANHATCLDPAYDVLWSYCPGSHEVSCYNVVSSEAANLKAIDSTYSDIFCPELAIPLRHGSQATRSHCALHVLACMDTHTTSQQLNMAIYEEQREKQITAKVFSKEDFLVVNRFESHGGGWGYSGHSIEAIRFMADADVLLGGFGLFGGRGEYYGRIKIFDLGPDGGENEADGELLAETEEMPYECGAREKYAMLFDEPVPLQAHTWYVAWARISGPSSDCGSSGQSTVTTDDQVVFRFKSSKKSNNGTDVNAGQIPQILYRLPTHDNPSGARKSDQAEPAHILSAEFSRAVSTTCFESLLMLLRWSWKTFTAGIQEVDELKGIHRKAGVSDLERLVYISTASLRLLRIYITEVYPAGGSSGKLPVETVKLAECVGNTRDLLREVLSDCSSQPVFRVFMSPANACTEYLHLQEEILVECHRTFTACFHAFYPTESLKWICLCDLLNLMEPGLPNMDGYGRLLAAIMEAMCHPSVKLTNIFPINCEHETEELLRRQSVSIDDNTNSAARLGDSHQYPILVSHMMCRTGSENSIVAHCSFKEILDRLLTIVTLPIRQEMMGESPIYPSLLVANTCSLLATIVSELASAALGSETEGMTTTRPMLTTPNRFTRTSQSAYWNTGNGSPDAVAFTVDRPGVVIAGVCVYGGTGQYDYELELLDENEGQGDTSHSQRWNSLELAKGTYGVDSLNEVAEIKFDRPVPVKENTKYAIRLRNHGPRTLNGDGGVSKVKCPDGTTFTFSACSLSINGTSHIRGQIPQILYYSAPQDGENHVQNNKALVEQQSRKNAISIASAICRTAKDLLQRAQAHLNEDIHSIVGKSHLFSSLLPLTLAYIGPVAAQDSRSAVQVLALVQDVLPAVSLINSELTPHPTSTNANLNANEAGQSGDFTTSTHFAIVESDHPYKPATVANYKVTFPENVKWVVLEFDPQCGTAQAEDSLQLYVPALTRHRPVHNKPSCVADKDDANIKLTHWPVLKKFSGLHNWPKQSVVLPGNSVVFSLETASDYVKDDKSCFYGFKSSVVGYEWTYGHNEGIQHLEKELSFLGGMCASSLMRQDVSLPPASLEEIDEDLDQIEEGAQMVFSVHSNLLSQGFALSNPPTIGQALDGNLPFCWQSNERAFLKDFVSCTAGTSGGRLARWLQPDSYLDPKQCDILYSKEELKCSWPVVITVQTKDQYGHLVNVPNLRVDVKAVPIDQKDSDDNKKIRRLSRPDDGDLTFGGHPPPCLDVTYQVTVKDKKDAFYAISMMKAYENYSFEELRYAAPSLPRPSENMLVRANNDGTYSANWTPGSIGFYNIYVTIDGFEAGDVYKVEVKEPPQGMTPPTMGNKKLHQPNKIRKFIGKHSAGLRIRSNPSLQSEQTGVIAPGGIIGFVDEVHNDDGVWVRLNVESIGKWCSNGYTEGWALQYNQHLGKTLLVPVEEPKSIEDLKEDAHPKLPDVVRDNRQAKKGGPGVYHLIRCGSSGHNIRCGPNRKARPIGMLVLDNTVTATEDLQNADGTWVKLDAETVEHYCHETEGEAWSLSRGPDGMVYLQHEADLIATPDVPKTSPFSMGMFPGAAASPSPSQKGYDFTSAKHHPTFSVFGPSVEGPLFGRRATLPANHVVFGQYGWPAGMQGQLPLFPAFGDSSGASGPTFAFSSHGGGVPGVSFFHQKMSRGSEGSITPLTKHNHPKVPVRAATMGSYIPQQEKMFERKDIPPELQGVSVKELVKALGKLKVEREVNSSDARSWDKPWEKSLNGLTVPGRTHTSASSCSPVPRRLTQLLGESRANANGPTPVPSPPGTPKKSLSRSSSPKPDLDGSKRSSPRPDSPQRSDSPGSKSLSQRSDSPCGSVSSKSDSPGRIVLQRPDSPGRGFLQRPDSPGRSNAPPRPERTDKLAKPDRPARAVNANNPAQLNRPDRPNANYHDRMDRIIMNNFDRHERDMSEGNRGRSNRLDQPDSNKGDHRGEKPILPPRNSNHKLEVKKDQNWAANHVPASEPHKVLAPMAIEMTVVDAQDPAGHNVNRPKGKLTREMSFETPPATPPTSRKELTGEVSPSSPRTLSPARMSPGRGASGGHTPASVRSQSPSAGSSHSSSGGDINIKAAFSIGTSSPKEEPLRMSPKSPKSGRKESRGRQLRTKRERAASPSPKEATPMGRARSASLLAERTHDSVKEALSPSVAECLRAVFAAFLWHEGIVHDAMACASFLKFNPNLSKEMSKFARVKNDGKDRVRMRHPTDSTHDRGKDIKKVDNLNININESIVQLGSEQARDKNEANDKATGRRLQVSSSESPIHRVDVSGGMSLQDVYSLEPVTDKGLAGLDKESQLPPTLHHLVYFWEELSSAILKVVNQDLIIPSPAANVKVKKGDKKDREKEKEKKSKKRRDLKPMARGNLFGEAAGAIVFGHLGGGGGGGGGGGDREAMCELCGGMYPHPVTYHMRQSHPGCGRHACGKGYNSGGNFCGGWAGNCGEGGIGGSSWYLMCDKCRDKYLREKKQSLKEKDRNKKQKKKSMPKQTSVITTVESHLVLKNNAMFLLELASAAGLSLPVQSHKKRQGMPRSDTLLPSVSEDGCTEVNPFPPIPFQYLMLRGAEACDSAFAEEIFVDQEERVFVRSGSLSSGSPRRTGYRPRLPTEPHGALARAISLGQDLKPTVRVSPLSPPEHSKPSVVETGRPIPKSAGTSPDSEHDQGRRSIFQRSISEMGDNNSVDANMSNRVVMTRRRNNSGGVGDGGTSLLKYPSAAMSKLISSVDKGSGSSGLGEKALQRPVLAFIIQRHDLDSLQLAMRQAVRKAACRVYAMQALNWLIRVVTHPSCLHDLLWFFVSSLLPPAEDEDEEDNVKEKKEKKDVEDKDIRVCEHPLSDITIAGKAAHPLQPTFHTLLQTIADVMMHLHPGSSLQQMAVRCYCLKFQQSDHQFLHESHVFSNISRILTKSDEESEEALESDWTTGKVTCLKDLTPGADVKASSRQAMVASLSDNSTETFWESGDEDRNKTKMITITCAQRTQPRMVYVHIDNSRDLGNKVSSVQFLAGASVDELKKCRQLEIEARHIGWVSSPIGENNCRYIRLELKGPDNNLRLRQVKVLGEQEGEALHLPVQKGALLMQQKNCETETLKVFRLLTSQVFGKLLFNGLSEGEEKQAESHEAPGIDNDLKEHMVGILFSRSNLSHLQKQVCAHIVQAIRKETERVKEEWESAYANKNKTVEDDNRVSDVYCFELLSMVLALSGSGVGRAHLAQQYGLLQDLFTLLHTATPRVQRQVVSVLRRVLPEVQPEILATILKVNNLPPADFSIVTATSRDQADEAFDPDKVGIIDVFLACIAKSLSVQTKVKSSGAHKGVTTVSLAESLSELPSIRSNGARWWLRGNMSGTLATNIIQLLQDMAASKLSEPWAAVTKAAIAEAILGLTKLDEAQRVPQTCIKTPTLWLALASLCVLDQEHVERLSSGQWVSHQDGQHGQPRPTCDNHDDEVTPAIILCSECGNLCADCDRFLHLHRKKRSHQRQVFKEEEEAIRVDLHEGCGRTKLFWVMALADSKTLKAMVEFREGKVSNPPGGPGTCRFCGTSSNTGLLAIGNVCADPDCQENARNACAKVHPCGHPCGGIKNEEPCLPCLHRCRSSDQELLKQDADDMCMICFTEALAAAPAIKLQCGHVFHMKCCQKVLEKRWVGPRITFGFSLCPICKSAIKHKVLKELLEPIRSLHEDVRRKALMRLEYEGLHKAEAITTPGARFHSDPAGFAMDRYAYYVCFKCKKAYYGGEVRCDEQAGVGDEYDPRELVCGACSDVSRAQMCPKHGTDFLEYKCRYCCSVAVFFCFGTTHFCNACHDDFQRVTNIPKHDLPHCPAGSRGKQLEGEECPLHVQHPPTGEEFALGCGVCRNAHTF